MKSYQEIKKEYSEKNYSIRELRWSILGFTLASFLFSELFIFIVSTIPFIIGLLILFSIFQYYFGIVLFYLFFHFLFYTFYVKKEYKQNLLEIYIEAKMIIKVLKELRKEKISS